MASDTDGRGFWIGSSDEIEEGNWVFMDGYSVTWTNWGDGEPSNSDDKKDYVEVDKLGKWRARSDSELSYSICKRGENSFIKIEDSTTPHPNI